MTVPPAPGLPPGRVLAAWWRQLAPHRPRRLWLADWLVHRLDVLVRCRRPATLEPIQHVLLDLLDIGRLPSVDFVALRLGLEPAFAAVMLRELADDELIQAKPAGSWSLTDTGREVLAGGAFLRPAFERRGFALRHDPPAFLPLTGHTQPVTLIDPPPAPLEELHACVRRPAEWKRRVGFPEEVAEVFDLTSPPPDAVPPWKAIPVDCPERLTAALILSDDRVLAFPIKPDGVTLENASILTLPAGDLALPDPSPDAWRAAWLDWSSDSDASTTTVERHEHQLVAKVSPSLAERLRSQRPESIQSETWLSAGDGQTREAVELAIRPA